MSLRVSSYTVEVGQPQGLEMTPGEDRRFQFAFVQGGLPFDMTSTANVKMTIRNRSTGVAVVVRSYTGFSGPPTQSTVLIDIFQADLMTAQPGAYDVDVQWVDGGVGYDTTLLVTSTLNLLKRTANTTDPMTTPPAIPVVYGIAWPTGLPGMWTTPSGGYQLNAGVMAYDGALGTTAISTFRALSAGVTTYPMTGTSQPTLATGWAYIGQHGGPPSVPLIPVVTGYSANPGDYVSANPSGGNFNVTLPSAGGQGGKAVKVKVNYSGTNVVVVYPRTGDQIDTVATGMTMAAGEFLAMTSDNNNTWMIG